MFYRGGRYNIWETIRQEATDGPLTLADLNIGEKCCIQGLGSTPVGYRNKMLVMGFLPGTIVKLRRKAPLGDPLELEIKGGSICVRQDEVANILVKLL